MPYHHQSQKNNLDPPYGQVSESYHFQSTAADANFSANMRAATTALAGLPSVGNLHSPGIGSHEDFVSMHSGESSYQSYNPSPESPEFSQSSMMQNNLLENQGSSRSWNHHGSRREPLLSLNPGPSRSSSASEKQFMNQREMERFHTSSQAGFHPSMSPLIPQQSTPTIPASSAGHRAHSHNIKSSPETTDNRGPSKRHILTLDARLTRLENMLEDVLPRASKIKNTVMSGGGRVKDKTREALELPEDPLLDGAVEDAMLAGQPIHQLHPSGSPASLSMPTDNITTAKLFLDSNQNFR